MWSRPVGSCRSRIKASNDRWVTRISAKRNILWHATHSFVSVRNSHVLCSSMHVSSHFRQSPANVTGDSAPVLCDSPPVTFGNAGSYDSFRVTQGGWWLIMQASRRQECGARSWRPIRSTAYKATPTLPRCPGDKDRNCQLISRWLCSPCPRTHTFPHLT